MIRLADSPEETGTGVAGRGDACVVIGGGPAGLTAAYELARLGRPAVVLEAEDRVGGLSRTCEHEGFRFDIGGHRFFTKVDYVQELWDEILGEEFLTRPRLSRIFYNGRFFDYPLKPANALRGLGLAESVRIGLSYLRARIAPSREEHTFEQWVVNRFGRRLFEIFFKSYTEKVWGMPCSEIGSEWAAQRIKNLDLLVAVKNALLGATSKGKAEIVTTLIDSFHYPRHGPGQMWSRCATLVEEAGGEVWLDSPVVRIRHADGQVRSVVVRSEEGREVEVHGEQFFSSMAIRTLVRRLDPPPPPEVLEAAGRLRYRDFMTVALIVDRAELFPDNWIYIHSPEVKVGRIQNYKNWSPDMVPDSSKTALGLEYFLQKGDALWREDDARLIELARKEVAQLGLARAEEILDGKVLRIEKAYPVYDDAYKACLATILGWLGGLPNLQLIGRNGQHRYNNQDHSMMTGVLAARNAVGASHDIWGVNVEEEYHEERRAGGDRLVPERAREQDLAALVSSAFGRYDPLALGAAIGLVAGVGLWLATAVLILVTPAGRPVGPTLSLLGNYLAGYEASWAGAFIGLAEAGLCGFAFGWVLAKMINLLVDYELGVLLRKVQIRSAQAVLEEDPAE